MRVNVQQRQTSPSRLQELLAQVRQPRELQVPQLRNLLEQETQEDTPLRDVDKYEPD